MFIKLGKKILNVNTISSIEKISKHKVSVYFKNDINPEDVVLDKNETFEDIVKRMCYDWEEGVPF